MEFGLIGEKLGHSYSPLIHRVFGDYDYSLYPMPLSKVETLLHSRNFRGLNVTIPYKRAVLPFCDELSPEVRDVGSANTLVVRKGRIYAYNTDLAGFLYMMNRAGIGLAGKKVVILGSGGTSLTAQAACRREHARETVVVSRQGPVNYDDLYTFHTDADVIINATPVGMYPRNLISPVNLSAFPGLSGVADVIYNPAKTALLLDAQAAGISCIDGLWMLAAQAWYAAKLFTAEDIPEAAIETAYRTVRRDCLNLVLIGMPGSGKTALGRTAAALLGRRFVDLDAEIRRRHGPIPEIFSRYGEGVFRDMESEVIREFGKKSGLVIATGGGAVLRPDNVRALTQNGLVVWVRRPLEQLSTRGRPLSTNIDALRRMAEVRMPLYSACSDCAIDNESGISATAKKLTEVFYEAAGH